MLLSRFSSSLKELLFLLDLTGYLVKLAEYLLFLPEQFAEPFNPVHVYLLGLWTGRQTPSHGLRALHPCAGCFSAEGMVGKRREPRSRETLGRVETTGPFFSIRLVVQREFMVP